MAPLSESGHREGFGPAAGDDQGEIFQEKRGGDGGDQQRNARGPAQRPVRAPLQEHPQEAGQGNGQAEGHRPGPGEEPHPHDRRVGGHHQQVAVGKVDEAQDAVNHGVTDGDEGIETAQGQAVD